MTDKHTPGPWHVGNADTARWEWDVYIEDGEYLRNVAHVPYASFEDAADCDAQLAYANARLIAAAPLMLEALREIVIRFSDEVEPYQIAREAIRAATGEDA